MAGAVHSFRVGGPAAASLLVNVLLIAALLNLGMGHVNGRTDTPPLTVLSLALLKGVEQGRQEAETAAPSTPAAVAPPSAEPPPASPPTAMAAIAPSVIAVPSRLSLPISVQPSGALPAPSQPARPAMTAASPSIASPARRGAADGLDVKAPAGASRSYAAKVRSWLYAHKIYPRRARMRREEGQVQVRFVLDRAGVLLEGTVVQRSGNAALDEEAEAMLRRASPYPRAPAELPGERIEFIVPIAFTLSA